MSSHLPHRHRHRHRLPHRFGLHRPSIVGRARTEKALLALTGLVVAVASLLVSATPVLIERTADHAVADAVARAGPDASLVATAPFHDEAPNGAPRRDPLLLAGLRDTTNEARRQLPAELAAVVTPPVTEVVSAQLQLQVGRPGRYLRLAYVADDHGPPKARWVGGGPPRAQPGTPQDPLTLPPGPAVVQVGLPQGAATALALQPGDLVAAEDEQHRKVQIRASGVFVPTDPGADTWRRQPELLETSRSADRPPSYVSATALVTDAALPDLVLAVPTEDLSRRVVFAARPTQLHWRDGDTLIQTVVGLKVSQGLASDGTLSWDTTLDAVLHGAQRSVSAARGQAAVLVVGLLTGTGLVLVLASQLLVRRQGHALQVGRERGASLIGIGTELFVVTGAVAIIGTTAGLAAAAALVGGASLVWALPVLVVAAFSGPVLGVLMAARTADRARVLANRTARTAAGRAQRGRRVMLEVAVLALATGAFIALRQRGVLPSDGASANRAPDLFSAGAPVWWAVFGGLIVLRLVPLGVRLASRAAARSSRAAPLLAAVGADRTARHVLPVLAVTLVVAQLTVCLALAATQQQGQLDGAWQEVGADARLQTDPSPSVLRTAGVIAAGAGVRTVVTARVADRVLARSSSTTDTVRLVVVDTQAFEALLAAGPLPDAPQLERLRGQRRGPPRALLRGGRPGLADGLQVSWGEKGVPLDVVGTAPAVGAGPAPMVVVDVAAFTAVGASAPPDTIWVLGAGADRAVQAAAAPADHVVLRSDVLTARRQAPLAAGAAPSRAGLRGPADAARSSRGRTRRRGPRPGPRQLARTPAGAGPAPAAGRRRAGR